MGFRRDRDLAVFCRDARHSAEVRLLRRAMRGARASAAAPCAVGLRPQARSEYVLFQQRKADIEENQDHNVPLDSERMAVVD